MTRPNKLTKDTPYAVKATIKELGHRLKTARLRRNIPASDLAAKIGISRQLVADAEAGKATTGIAVYVGLLWAMNLLGHLDNVAAPTSDIEGLTLASRNEPQRARIVNALDDNF